MKVKSLYPILVVEDLEAAKGFYCGTMGFQVKHDLTRKDGGHVLVLCNEQGLEIEVMEQSKSDAMHFETGLYGLRINVDNIETAMEELKAQGCEILTGILDTEVSKNLLIRDKNGVNITLMQHIKK